MLDRIKNLELELNSYKSYVAESLPKNKDFVESDIGSESNTRKSNRSSNRKSNRKTITFGDDDDDKNAQSSKFKELIEDLTERNKSLEEDERNALVKFEKEYRRKVNILEETNKIK